jgi:hypothetical protein
VFSECVGGTFVLIGWVLWTLLTHCKVICGLFWDKVCEGRAVSLRCTAGLSDLRTLRCTKG